jgi:signal transduction histidine kinase/ligand-binding sensor domain-containing protein/CheY-like chemotaxis protein/AraC-like DNA-binding protein
MKQILAIILLMLCLVLPERIESQTYKSFVQIPTDADASMVASIIQDRSGMIWLGTNKGLYSYDGYSVYAHNKGHKDIKTHIYCGLDIGGSQLYLGSDNGLIIYNYRTDSYEALPAKFPKDIRAIVKDGNAIWLGSLEGLFRYDFATKKLSHFETRHYAGLSHNTIYSIIKGSDNRIYIGTYNGFCYYDKHKHGFTKIPLPSIAQKSNVFVNSLLEDRPSGCIWIGTEGNLYRYSLKSGKVERISGFNDNSVKALALDSNHKLLVGTDNGLFVYNGSHIEQHVLHDSRNSSSLSNDVVWSLLRDSNGNIWLGTDDGISMESHIQDIPFTRISQITGVGAGNHFYSIFRDFGGTLWLGGSNGLISTNISLSSPQTSRWYRVDNPVYPIAHNRIRQIYEDREKHLWICTDGGLHRYENGQWHRYNLEDRTRTMNANWAYNVYEDERGRLWVATCLGGILVVDKHKLERSKDYCIADYSFGSSNGLAGMFVNQLVPDSRGNIWVLLYNNGLQCINTHTMRIQHIGLNEFKGDNNPNFLLSDSLKHLWVGLRGGVLYIGDGYTKPHMIVFKNFGQGEITAMAEVKNEIWVCSTDGVWIINKKTMKGQRIYSANQTFSCIYYDKRSNLIFLGSVDGLVCTSPENLRRKIQRHSLQLIAVYSNNEQHFNQNGRSFRFFGDIEFAADENHLVFEFSDLPYAQAEKDHFFYKLEGVDNDWNTLPQNSNHITFNNLPSGSYKLLISRLNANGEPSSPLVVPFKILPHWYYSLWAKIFYTILLMALVWWLFKFYRMRNRLRLERIEKERVMEQSRQKMDFFTNISHDFKTPLSMIIAPLSRLLQEIKESNLRTQLELAQRNAMKLTAMIHQLIDFDRVENNVNSTLMLGRVDFVQLAYKVFCGFEDGIFRDKSIETKFDTNIESVYMQVDELKIESTIANLLSNAAKYTPDRGSVHMSLLIDTNTVKVAIQDTGIGIPAKDLPYVSQRFFQSSKTKGKKEGTGIGLYMARAYTELHGGTFSISSEEGHGTLVTLTFPAGNLSPDTQLIDTIYSPMISGDSDTLPLVIIVDDNKDMIEFMTVILKPYFRCMSAYDGKTGLDLCISQTPSLIITDVMMPVMDGMEMCHHLRDNVPTSTTPIIMLTAKNDKITELESIRINIDAFLVKPFDANILLLRAQQLVNKYNLIEKKKRIGAISEPKAIEAVSEDEKFLSQITALIEDCVGDFEMNVNSLCERMGLGNKLVYRKLKQLTGQTPVEYIRIIRMKKAAMLLSQQKFTVAEVMYMVGYSNTSYFSKCFQTEFGVTPRQYSEKK